MTDRKNNVVLSAKIIASGRKSTNMELVGNPAFESDKLALLDKLVLSTITSDGPKLPDGAHNLRVFRQTEVDLAIQVLASLIGGLNASSAQDPDITAGMLKRLQEIQWLSRVYYDSEND